MGLVERKCSNCGATLPRPENDLHVRCEFCGAEWDIRPPAPPPQAPQFPPQVQVVFHAPRPVVRVSRGAVGKGCGCALAIVLLVVAIGAATAWFTLGGVGAGLPGLDGIARPRLSFHRTVALVQVNGDGVEDVVFQFRTPGANDEMHIGVWDGASFAELWRAGPFGTYIQAYQHTHAAIVGNRMLVTDFRAQGHLYDLASGVQVAGAPLPDRAKRLCAAPAGGTQVWMEAENGQHAVIDTATGMTQAATAPPWGVGCAESSDLSAPKPPPGSLSVTVAGFESEQVLSDGARTVAIGKRASGIRVPMAVGISADGRTPTWSVVVPTVDEALVEADDFAFALANGRLFYAYSLSNDTGRLAAFDAATGARLWESELPKCCAHGVDVENMRIGPTRLVTEQFAQAEFWDVATGTLLGRISPW